MKSCRWLEPRVAVTIEFLEWTLDNRLRHPSFVARGIYSLVAFATIGPLIYEFARNKHAGPLLWYLRDAGDSMARMAADAVGVHLVGRKFHHSEPGRNGRARE